MYRTMRKATAGASLLVDSLTDDFTVPDGGECDWPAIPVDEGVPCEGLVR
jgi:hypothetical protein